MAKITIPHATLDSDEGVFKLAVEASVKGATHYPDGDNVIYDIFNHLLEPNVALYLHSVNCFVEDYPLFLEVSPDDLVEQGFLGAPEGSTFKDLVLTNHSFIDYGGRQFIGTDAFTGYPLPISELVAFAGKLFLGKEITALAPSE